MAFDLSSYGVALAIVNRFVDNETVDVFEISPAGQLATLLLLVKDEMTLKILKSETTSIFREQILHVEGIENFAEDLLKVYLSQTQAKIQTNILVSETESVAKALAWADKCLKNKLDLVDFRSLRTQPKNIIVTITHSQLAKLIEATNPQFKNTLIEKVEPSLKVYYEVVI